jgi:AcrR family transcriptional regulator
VTNTIPEQNLLILGTLEAVLAKSASRLDTAARAERLKAAALMECAEQGYSNLTIAEVAKRAKVSTATIHGEYKDRDTLLVAAMEMLFGIVANDVIERPAIADPVQRVEWLLLAHGFVYAQPLATWFFRLHVTLAWAGHPHLHDIGQRVFEGIDAFWAGFLDDLIAQELLVPVDLAVAVPLILGPIERCTIISRLGCGEDEAGRPALADVARHTAENLFKVWGGPAFAGAKRAAADHPAPLPANTFLTTAIAPKASPAPSSLAQRLEAALAENTAPQTPARRKTRILLAAAVECQERGYNDASMIEVAARAGVSTATLYRHYDEKKTLFTCALEQELRTRLPKPSATDAAANPTDDIAAALFTMAQRDADPDWVWIPNILMASEVSGTAPIVALAREQRAATETFWAARLAALTEAGHLAPCDPAMAINQLLGPIERSGVLALILFGKAGVDQARLAQLARASAAFLFQRYGGARQSTSPE